MRILTDDDAQTRLFSFDQTDMRAVLHWLMVPVNLQKGEVVSDALSLRVCDAVCKGYTTGYIDAYRDLVLNDPHKEDYVTLIRIVPNKGDDGCET